MHPILLLKYGCDTCAAKFDVTGNLENFLDFGVN